MTIQESNIPVSSGMGRVISVIEHYLNTGEKDVQRVYDLSSLQVCIANLSDDESGRSALRAICCAILNRDIRQSGTVFWVGTTGDVLSVDDISANGIEHYLSGPLSR